jgi:integrase
LAEGKGLIMAGARKRPNKRSGKFQAYYADWRGKRVFFVGTASRRETLDIARKLEDEQTQIRLGYKPAPTAAARHRSRAFLEAVQEHISWGRTFGRKDGKPWTAGFADRKADTLKKWAETLGLETLADLDGILPRVEAVLRELADTGLMGSTLSSRVKPLVSFCNWCVVRGYLSSNPLKALGAIDATPESERRALTAEEIAKLFSVAPGWRRLVYAVALTTGLRLSELRRLDRGDLDVENGRLCLRWKQTKNKKPATQYLPAKLVEQLASFAESGSPSRLYENAKARYALPSSPLLFVPTHILRRFDKDLERVGIPKETSEGRLDFHALRASFITLGAEAGANVKELQTMARHADPRLTFGVYAKKRDARLAELAEKIGESVVFETECATSVHPGVESPEQAARKLLPELALSLTKNNRGLPHEGTGPDFCL